MECKNYKLIELKQHAALYESCASENKKLQTETQLTESDISKL